MSTDLDPFGARASLSTSAGPVTIYRLDRLSELGFSGIDRLPFTIQVWLESLLRQCNRCSITEDHVANLARWRPDSPGLAELPLMPARVLLQDFTGVPSVVDLAALRSAMHRLGGDPHRINPQIPVDLVIDHSVQVDKYGTDDALQVNSDIEFRRNRERYEFLHWAQHAFDSFTVVPPATGIVHQVNLEYLATVVATRPDPDGSLVAFPDSLIGTDSHMTMIAGLGVLGWGVGGIEAEAVMLGEPLSMLPPEVIGFRLVGELPEGATATDLVLTVTQMLRQKGVVGKFVEYFGPGVKHLTLPDRATVSNMSPEYGATVGFFPVDGETLRYLRQTGRPADRVDLVERYTRAQGLFRVEGAPDPLYTEILTLDLSTVEPSLAGPKRPQDRVLVRDLKTAFRRTLQTSTAQRGFAVDDAALARTATAHLSTGHDVVLTHGSVAIAAITSCTNTSNPSVMIGAGLLAKKAVEHGLRTPPHVKTSLAPGSRAVTSYLDAAGLTPYLNQLGFNLVGYGCTTCIGNSGPLPEPVAQAVQEGNLVVAAVLSGNRNFEGRINPLTQASYLGSPLLCVAYGLAGTLNVDLLADPLGHDPAGRPVYLRDIWPTQAEIQAVVDAALRPEIFSEKYADVYTANQQWNAIPVPDIADLYKWDPTSTYIQEPPFFVDMAPEPPPAADITGARVLVLLGDSVTTDHISPAGAIAVDSPAGDYLIRHGVARSDFNSYGSRRGNHEVMMRGTFANIRLKNLLLPGTEGDITLHLPDRQSMSIYDAAMRYRDEGIPLLVLAGREYGTGSSRDWAAKGVGLLGVRAVIAESYERIHRSNLVGLGVLPLQFLPGQSAQTLGLTGLEEYSISGIAADLAPGRHVTVRARGAGGATITFSALARLDTAEEAEYYRHGGILNMILRRLLH
jgi:aconitate hydratase A / 2-methylisocitrate dehydratase